MPVMNGYMIFSKGRHCIFISVIVMIYNAGEIGKIRSFFYRYDRLVGTIIYIASDFAPSVQNHSFVENYSNDYICFNTTSCCVGLEELLQKHTPMLFEGRKNLEKE